MPEAPGRRLLNDGVQAMVAAVTALKTGLAEVPDDIERNDDGTLHKPYYIIYPLPGRVVHEHASLADPDGTVLLPYQITTVGSRKEQVQDGADLCRASITRRNPSGEYTNAIAAGPGMAVINRDPTELGGPEPSGGGLWQVADIFHLEVSEA